MGVCCHHDAGGSSQSTQGRADYSCNAQYAPVGNFILGVGGLNDIIMIAAGASNTQGKGGPYQTSKGQVPLDDGNRRMIAIEAANTGTGTQDWNPAQQVAYLTLCAALIECYGLKSSDVVSHSDWTNPVGGGRTNVMSGSKRKIDPGGGATPGRDWAEPKAVYKNMWVMDRFARDIDRLIADRNAPKPPPYTPYPPRPEAILGVDKDMQILANPSAASSTPATKRPERSRPVRLARFRCRRMCRLLACRSPSPLSARKAKATSRCGRLARSLRRRASTIRRASTLRTPPRSEQQEARASNCSRRRPPASSWMSSPFRSDPNSLPRVVALGYLEREHCERMEITSASCRV